MGTEEKNKINEESKKEEGAEESNKAIAKAEENSTQKPEDNSSDSDEVIDPQIIESMPPEVKNLFRHLWLCLLVTVGLAQIHYMKNSQKLTSTNI